MFRQTTARSRGFTALGLAFGVTLTLGGMAVTATSAMANEPETTPPSGGTVSGVLSSTCDTGTATISTSVPAGFNGPEGTTYIDNTFAGVAKSGSVGPAGGNVVLTWTGLEPGTYEVSLSEYMAGGDPSAYEVTPTSITVGPCEEEPPPPVDEGESKKITYCHATPADTAANGWNTQTTSVNAFYQSGHPQHSADIVPPFTYIKKGETVNYPGLNWDAEGQAVFNNGCVKPTPPPPVCTDDTKAAGSWTKTSDQSWSIVLTKDLCHAIHADGVSWDFMTTNLWPQNNPESGGVVLIQTKGTYTLTAPDKCGQTDPYAEKGKDPVYPDQLNGPNNPYEPHFISDFFTGQGDPWTVDDPKKCAEQPKPKGKLLVSADCESITVGSKGVKPEGAEQVFKIDGVVVQPGTHPATPGTHTVDLYVNGKKVDSKTVEVKECPPNKDQYLWEFYPPDCFWDTAYLSGVYTGDGGDTVAVQRHDGEVWVDEDSEQLIASGAFFLETSGQAYGESRDYRLVASNEGGITVLEVFEDVTRPSEDECAPKELPYTTVSVECGVSLFTNNAEEAVTVFYGSFDELEPDGSVNVAPGQTVAVETERTSLDWYSVGSESGYYAGSGTVNVPQDCDNPPTEPPVITPPTNPEPPRSWNPPAPPKYTTPGSGAPKTGGGDNMAAFGQSLTIAGIGVVAIVLLRRRFA